MPWTRGRHRAECFTQAISSSSQLSPFYAGRNWGPESQVTSSERDGDLSLQIGGYTFSPQSPPAPAAFRRSCPTAPFPWFLERATVWLFQAPAGPKPSALGQCQTRDGEEEAWGPLRLIPLRSCCLLAFSLSPIPSGVASYWLCSPISTPRVCVRARAMVRRGDKIKLGKAWTRTRGHFQDSSRQPTCTPRNS